MYSVQTMISGGGTPGVRRMANYGGFANQLPLGCAGQHVEITCMYAQVREEEQFIAPQFVASRAKALSRRIAVNC